MHRSLCTVVYAGMCTDTCTDFIELDAWDPDKNDVRTNGLVGSHGRLGLEIRCDRDGSRAREGQNRTAKLHVGRHFEMNSQKVS